MIARLNVGGPAQHVLHLTERLAVTYPTLLVAGSIAEGEADMMPIARARGLPLLVIPELGREIRFLADIRVAWKLYLLFRSIKPAIVHTHTAKAGTVARVAAIAAGVPVLVHTFHGHVFRGYFGRLKTALFIGIERTLARFTDAIIAVSESQANDLAVAFSICARERIQVIPLGLDLDRFAQGNEALLRDEFRASLGVGEDESVVSIVGRLVPIKNHDLFLEAAERVLRAKRRCTFAIIGGGTEDSRLRRRALEMGIADHVHFLGWREDLERVYAGTDVVALTSDNEGTPVCLIEAMAAGRAIVATDVGGVSDVLEGGRCGRIVAAGDPDRFADALMILIDDPELRASYAARGRDSAPGRFGVQRLVADITRLYQQMMPATESIHPLDEGYRADIPR